MEKYSQITVRRSIRSKIYCWIQGYQNQICLIGNCQIKKLNVKKPWQNISAELGLDCKGSKRIQYSRGNQSYQTSLSNWTYTNSVETRLQ